MRQAALIDTGTGRISCRAAADGSTLVELHGDIDAEVVEPLKDCVAWGIEHGTDILIDAADVTLIDCVSLSALVRGAEHADRRGHHLRLRAPSPKVRLTLAATGLNAAFHLAG